jgi:hypothetical protein
MEEKEKERRKGLSVALSVCKGREGKEKEEGRERRGREGEVCVASA